MKLTNSRCVCLRVALILVSFLNVQFFELDGLTFILLSIDVMTEGPSDKTNEANAHSIYTNIKFRQYRLPHC